MRTTKAEEPSGFHSAVTHVFGLFCNASAKYAHLGAPGGGPNGTMFQIMDSSLFFAGMAPSQCNTTQRSGACNNQWTDCVTATRLGETQSLGVLFATTVGGTENMGSFYSFGASGGGGSVPLPQLFQLGNFIRRGRFN